MASDYDGLTVAELKELLRDRDLPVSGAKASKTSELGSGDYTTTFTPTSNGPVELTVAVTGSTSTYPA